jgi:hypothetical protein
MKLSSFILVAFISSINNSISLLNLVLLLNFSSVFMCLFTLLTLLKCLLRYPPNHKNFSNKQFQLDIFLYFLMHEFVEGLITLVMIMSKILPQNFVSNLEKISTIKFITL